MIATVCHSRRKRVGWLFFLLLSIVFLFIGCTLQPTTPTYRIGFSQCVDNDQWRQTMLAEMKRELSFHSDIELLYRNSANNSARQVQQIEELVKEKIDLLIVSPNEVTPLTPAIEKVYNAGIPVVLVDRQIGSGSYSAFIGASNFEVGQNAGEYAVSILKGVGNVIEVTAIPTNASPEIDRHNGFMNVIQQHPGIHYLKKIDDNTRPFLQTIAATLQNSTVDLIYVQNDPTAFEVYKILKRMGLTDKVKIIGIDGLPAKGAGLDMVANKYISATVLYPTGGSEAIATAISILEKKPYKKENRLATTVIDSSNVRIMKLQNEKVVAQEADIDKRQQRINEQTIISRNQNNIIFAISLTLALALILGGVLLYYLLENRKITRKLVLQNHRVELQKTEITDQRNKLIELVDQVKEANAAKVNFFTNISHELRTPLTLILGPLEDALASPKLHFTVKNNLQFIEKNAIRLLRLINQLMDFRKMEEGKMQLHASENNLADFVSGITASFHDLARKKGIQFTVLNEAEDLKIWFDTTMLDKVLFNLLSNAFKFTDEGSIKVITNKSKDGQSAIIQVSDTGVGMSTEDLEHAFDVFYQGHSSTFKGTGLGLSLSKELVGLHQGSLTVANNQNKGVTFTLSLPLGRQHLAPEALQPVTHQPLHTYEDEKIYTTDLEPVSDQPAVEQATNELSILLIEDNEHLRAFLKQRLSPHYEIQEATNGDAGIALAREVVPDLIVSDIVMPGSSGLQLTETLKQDIRTSHIPVILLTAKDSIEEQIEGIQSQADAFITKPFNLQHLEATIRNLLKNREVLRQHYTSELPTEVRANTASKIDRKFVNEFTAIVEKNIGNEAFSVDQICKDIGVSRVQLYRKVKALIGYNINDYILMVRMQKAKYLLTQGHLTISEITHQTGFASQAYFSTVFKSKFGVSPSEFKAGKPMKK